MTGHASGNARWWILALLFFATTINYLDRIVFSVLIPVIRQEMHITDQEYGYINAAFQIFYTVGFLFAGGLIDKWGTRLGYAVSIAWWSLAAAGHVIAGSGMGLSFWRGFMGLGESGNFPAAIKSVAEWFSKEDRAFATGIFNAGATVSSIVGPPLFAWLVVFAGWRACFLMTAAAGFVWLIFWLLAPKPPQQVEVVGEPRIGWAKALTYRETWGFAAAKFFSDPVWWFYLYWLPPYFFDVRKMNLKEIGWALPVIYTVAGVGSVVGGWLAGVLIRRGWRPGPAHKAGMAVFAFMMPVGALSVPDLRRHRRPPGLVSQPLHDRFRHLPQPRCRLGHRHRRLRGRFRRSTLLRPHPRLRRQPLRLHASLPGDGRLPPDGPGDLTLPVRQNGADPGGELAHHGRCRLHRGDLPFDQAPIRAIEQVAHHFDGLGFVKASRVHALQFGVDQVRHVDVPNV
jgi:ACS family hexuronate transporter-like MFS transporter